MLLILLVLILVILLGMPQTGWHQYGYVPSGVLAVVLVVLLLLVLLGYRF